MVPTVPMAGLGSTVTAWQLDALVPHPLLAVQQIVPEEAPAKETVTERVPWPAVIVAPAGTVHVLTGAGLPVLGTVYTTPVCPLHTVAGPVMVPGVGATVVDTVTGKHFIGLVLQLLPADTHTLPLVTE
jgi:hypothetical protein